MNRVLSVDAAQLVQQGIERYQAGEFKGAIALWQTALSQFQNDRENTAIVLENIARAYQQLGTREPELDYWQQAIALNRQLGDFKQVARLLVEAAQTYSRLGQPKTAIALLCSANQSVNQSGACTSESALSLARKTHDLTTEAAALGSLGEVYRLTGNYKTAIAVLQSSLDLTQQPSYALSAFMSLGNTHSSLSRMHDRRAESAEQRGDTVEAEQLKQLGKTEDLAALHSFQSSLAIAQTLQDAKTQVRALLSTIPVNYRLSNINAVNTAIQQATTLLATLPKSRDRVYAAIALARLLQSHEPVSKTTCSAERLIEAQSLLDSAVTIAAQIQDQRASSFALGELGHLYECRGDYAQALFLTQKARWAAEQHQDSLYLWEWQTGRILRAQGDRRGAISAYDRAITSLDTIRSDILTANRDLQFDFRDTVEPVYRELVSLRLESETTQSSKANESVYIKPDTDNLNATLNVMDSLRLAELQNYFGNDCVLTATTVQNHTLTSPNQSTATFSSILLSDHIAIVLSLPNHQHRIALIKISSAQFRQEVNEFRRGLERFYDEYDPSQARQLYDQIIRPFEAELAQIKTLVFVQDGILRTIPMAALYDGQKFLVQRYAIATTPSLKLVQFKPFDRQNLRALALGITQSATVDGRQFQALANVSEEIREVEMQIPGKQLLDRNFTRDQLQQELSKHSYPIIHIATHGEFGTDPDNTFIITGNNQKLTLAELDALIRNTTSRQATIELLTLTACQTAAGDDRAALGLAGVAVQAGAKSAIASLWFINDAATAKLATTFYANFRKPNTPRAQALQTAQIALIESGGQFSHPAYWAPFILVGSWQ